MYDLYIVDIHGVYLYKIKNTISVEIAHGKNRVGKMSIIVHIGNPVLQMISRHTRIIANRRTDRVEINEGNTLWLVRTIEYDLTEDTCVIYAEDLNCILKDRLVAYPQDSVQADKTLDNGTNGPADDLIKAYVRENIGSLCVDTDRIMLDLTVDDDLSEFAVTEKTASMRVLFDTISEIAEEASTSTVMLFFGLELHPVPVSGIIHKWFYTEKFDADDTTSSCVLSLENGSLSELAVTEDYSDEVTYVYVGGDGNGLDRIIAEISDDDRIAESEFNRIEEFVSLNDAIDDAVLEAEGRSALTKGMPKKTLKATINSDGQFVYGINYFVGSVVDVNCIFGIYRSLITGVHITQEEDETIEIEMVQI